MSDYSREFRYKKPRGAVPVHCGRQMRRIYTECSVNGKLRKPTIGWMCPDDLYTNLMLDDALREVFRERMGKTTSYSKQICCETFMRGIWIDFYCKGRCTRRRIGYFCTVCGDVVYDMTDEARDML